LKKIICLAIIIVLIFVCNINIMAAVEKPISFLQDDSEWGSKPYTITGSSY
jgi:hypothetical protein